MIQTIEGINNLSSSESCEQVTSVMVMLPELGFYCFLSKLGSQHLLPCAATAGRQCCI